MLMLGFWQSTFRSIFFFLDTIVYGFIPVIYNFINVLAKQKLLNQATIESFANNIYVLLAVFMLFRLAFVLLNAIIDPDKLTNKDKGFGKIMTRFITGIFLIVAIPWAFDYAYKLQDMIISKDIITKIVFGADAQVAATPGETLAKTTLSAFYYCKDVQGTEKIVDGKPVYDSNGNAIQEYTCDLDSAYNTAFPAGSTVTANRNWSILVENLNKSDESGGYKYDYSAGISTVCGVVILLMLITFSFDVALRIVKLAFLQLMTPIAVVGYIEPGGKRFNEWLKVSVTTFTNLFIRLLAVSFASYIIALVDPNNFTPVDIYGAPMTSFMQSSFVRIFIILGCLLFVKEGPKMLADILGIKEGNMGGLNPLNKLKSVPFIGGAAAAGVGMGIGGAMKGAAGGVGALTGGFNSLARKGNFGAGAIRGGAAAMKNVPLKGKLGDQAKGLLGSYRKAANAGATSAKGIETHTGLGALVENAKGFLNDTAEGLETSGSAQKFNDVITKNGRITELFSDKDAKDAFDEYSNNKIAKKVATEAINGKDGVDGYQQIYDKKQLGYNTASTNLNNANSAFSQASTNLQNALSTRNAVQAQAKSLEEARDTAWQKANMPGGSGQFDRNYMNARDAYSSYTSTQDYTDALTKYADTNIEYTNADTALKDARKTLGTAQGELQSAQADLLNGQSNLRKYEKDFNESESKLNTVLERPGNKKDSDLYKAYKSAKNAGLLKKER